MYLKKIYVSGGSAHELQAVFSLLPGIEETKTGYIDLPENNTLSGDALYEAVTKNELPAVIGLEISYNPKKTDLSTILDLHFAVVSPHLPDGQGKAKGSMYRPGVWYKDGEDQPQIELYMNFLQNRGKPPAVTGASLTMNDPNSNKKNTLPFHAKAARLKNFLPADEAHQHYLKKHPETETFIDFRKLKETIKF